MAKPSVPYRQLAAEFVKAFVTPGSDGSAWRRLGGLIDRNFAEVDDYVAAGDLLRAQDGTTGDQTGIVGGTMTHGTDQLLIQSGSTAGTLVFGALVVTLPTPFPNGILSIVVSQGNASVGGAEMLATTHPPAVDEFIVSFYEHDGTASSGSRRVNWIAVGW